MDARGRDGLSVSFGIGVVLVLVVLIAGMAVVWIALGGKIGLDPKQSVQTDISGFIGEMTLVCDQGEEATPVTKTHRFDEHVDKVYMKDPSTLAVDIDTDETLTYGTSSCSQISICQDGAAGESCATGGSLQPVKNDRVIEMTLHLRSPGHLIIDPSPPS